MVKYKNIAIKNHYSVDEKKKKLNVNFHLKTIIVCASITWILCDRLGHFHGIYKKNIMHFKYNNNNNDTIIIMHKKKKNILYSLVCNWHIQKLSINTFLMCMHHRLTAWNVPLTIRTETNLIYKGLILKFSRIWFKNIHCRMKNSF